MRTMRIALLTLLLAGCIRVNVQPPQEPPEDEKRPDVGVIVQRGTPPQVARPIERAQRVRIRCTDPETACLAVHVFMEPERTFPSPRRMVVGGDPIHVAALSEQTPEGVFEFTMFTEDWDDGEYLLVAYGCTEELRLTQETLAESPACSMDSRRVRLR